MSKILLTGGAGYIGTHTCVVLLENGYDIVVGDNFSNSDPKALERVCEITGKNITIHKTDFTNPTQVEKLFSLYKFDGVIHFAGFKAVGESVSEPLKYYHNNLNSTINLLSAMKKHSVSNLVFSSSATVYSPENPIPYVEGMARGCTNPYGWTKFMSEQIISDFAVSTENFSAVLLRYFNPIGAHPSGLIGENPSGIPNNLMPYITQVAVKKREYLSVYGKDYPTKDGTGVRDYIHITDLAYGHLKALEYAFEHQNVEVFNVGTGNGFSVLEVVETFKSENDIDIPYKICPRRPGDIAEFYADTQKAKEGLDWQAKKGIKEMCKDSWNWQKNNPDGYK